MQAKPNNETKILFETKEDKILVEADKGRIAQVISNLLNNSLRFTRSEAKISLTSEKNDSRATVSVKDTATGIDPQIMPKLFSSLLLNLSQVQD